MMVKVSHFNLISKVRKDHYKRDKKDSDNPPNIVNMVFNVHFFRYASTTLSSFALMICSRIPVLT